MGDTLEVGKNYWVADPDACWRQLKLINIQNESEATVAGDGEEFTVDLSTSQIYRCNGVSDVDDMTSLHFLNEPSLLQNLEVRYKNARRKPYTFMANVLVTVNPLEYLPDPPKQQIASTQTNQMPPHPYAIAEFAYRQLFSKRSSLESQSMVISGESGSGKTETSKMVLDYLTVRGSKSTEKGGGADSNPEFAPQSPEDESGLSPKEVVRDRADTSPLGKRLMETIPILESFGNAKTQRNHNSSRFGKYMRLWFCPETHELVSASIDTYLLESSRLVHRPSGERNFHIFYQLLSGLGQAEKEEYGIDTDGVYHYLNDGPAVVEEEFLDTRHFSNLCQALGSVGISDQQQSQVFQTIAGCLHLGNITFREEETAEGQTARINSVETLKAAAQCLGVKPEVLDIAICQKRIAANRSRGSEYYLKRDVTNATYARDSIAKIIYAQLFSWLVQQITSSLGIDVPKAYPYIGVLDIFGFESFDINGYEQLLINYANESLHNIYTKSLLVAEQELYQSENIRTQVSPFEDNSGVLDLIAGKPHGLLPVLDLIARTADSSDRKYIEKVHALHARNPVFPRPHPRHVHKMFTIKHFAGLVSYTVEAFVDKNNNIISAEIGSLLLNSSSDLVASLLPSNYLETLAKRKRSLLTRSVSAVFTTQMSDLISELQTTRVNYVRCFKPNMEMDAKIFDRKYVAEQLRYSGTVQTCEVLKVGLPTRITYQEVEAYYKEKRIPSESFAMFANSRRFVEALLWAYEIPRDTYQLGTNRLFFRYGEVTRLEELLQETDSQAKQEWIMSRLRTYRTRKLWRIAFRKVCLINKWKQLLSLTRRRGSVRKISFCWTNYRVRQKLRVVRHKLLVKRRWAQFVRSYKQYHYLQKASTECLYDFMSGLARKESLNERQLSLFNNVRILCKQRRIRRLWKKAFYCILGVREFLSARRQAHRAVADRLQKASSAVVSSKHPSLSTLPLVTSAELEEVAAIPPLSQYVADSKFRSRARTQPLLGWPRKLSKHAKSSQTANQGTQTLVEEILLASPPLQLSAPPASSIAGRQRIRYLWQLAIVNVRVAIRLRPLFNRIHTKHLERAIDKLSAENSIMKTQLVALMGKAISNSDARGRTTISGSEMQVLELRKEGPDDKGDDTKIVVDVDDYEDTLAEKQSCCQSFIAFICCVGKRRKKANLEMTV